MIGTILRNMRKIKGLTQAQIGKKLNLAENTISNYETEYSNPTSNFGIKLHRHSMLQKCSTVINFYTNNPIQKLKFV